MFGTIKTIACLEFTKTSVFCALAQITGRKVDILAIDEINVENGILEEGIVYDIPHLQQIVKNLITSVSKNQSKIDAAWLSIPDNKIKISKFEIQKDKKGIDQYELHRVIEEHFGHPANKLYLINKPVHELNQKVFFLANAIREDHISPFLQLLEPLNIPIEAVFPTFQSLFQELKDQFTVPTLVLYPYGKGYKFFIADSNGVHLESVWGHNVIEFNENLDKAVEEIIQYAKQSKDIAIGVKKIMAIESPKLDSELLQIYLRRTGTEFSWVPDTTTNSAMDPVAVTILKGLIKNAMDSKFNKGFLEEQSTHNDDPIPQASLASRINGEKQDMYNKFQPTNYIATPTRSTIVKSPHMLDDRWNIKVIIVTILLGIILMGSIGYAGWKISERVAENNKNANDRTIITPTSSIPTSTTTPSPTPTVAPSITSEPTPTPSIVPDFTKDEITVLVLNGNNVTGEAKKINEILKANGFKTKTPGNNPVKNIATTSITYRDNRSKNLAEQIVKIIEPNYSSAKANFDPGASEDILIVLGAR